MTALSPEPGSPEEEALVQSATASLLRARHRPAGKLGIHPAYQATRPVSSSLSPHGELFKRAISAAWLAHHRGQPVTPDTMQIYDAGLDPADLSALLETELFRQALEDRGIPDSGATYLSDKQMAALIILSDHSVRRPERKKLQMAGVSWTEFQGWLSNPLFRREYRELQRRTLELATERGDTVLAQLIDDGNIRAIEYANAMTGKYDPASREAQSAASILQMVVSIVQKHVTDEVALRRLADDFERLAASGGLQQLETLDAEVIENDPAD